MMPLNSARRDASIGVVYYRDQKNDPFSTHCLYDLGGLSMSMSSILSLGGWRATPVLSSTTQGAYGAHLRELELELVERGLGRKGADLRTLEVGTGLRVE